MKGTDEILSCLRLEVKEIGVNHFQIYVSFAMFALAASIGVESERWQGVAIEVLEIRVQWLLAASDVWWLRTSSLSTDGHRRANSPLVPPASRNALIALILINFSSAR